MFHLNYYECRFIGDECALVRIHQIAGWVGLLETSACTIRSQARYTGYSSRTPDPSSANELFAEHRLLLTAKQQVVRQLIEAIILY